MTDDETEIALVKLSEAMGEVRAVVEKYQDIRGLASALVGLGVGMLRRQGYTREMIDVLVGMAIKGADEMLKGPSA